MIVFFSMTGEVTIVFSRSQIMFWSLEGTAGGGVCALLLLVFAGFEFDLNSFTREKLFDFINVHLWFNVALYFSWENFFL